ncbi:multicopper oxidase domain-containing protein [Cohnella terricola]|uniref:Copper-containing nitrite reductase n=1 Tax=Cohnella terricola TaxID=1289167 RepID=A0A559JTT0_9BACL|nr:multicopper oxidase domain-containing protein [Cohnella terricola]TVY03257.1 twin-arginine translocation signal domain-containing protein [Cohnella terricola]
MFDRRKQISRRSFLKAGAAGAAALIGGALLNPGALLGGRSAHAESHEGHEGHAESGHGSHGMQHGFTPGTEVTEGLVMAREALSNFDYGKVSTLPDGRTLREYEIVSFEKDIEIAQGVKFPAWTFNGTVPGPTIRCTEGDVVRVKFSNASSHPHSIHFHGIHPTDMDGLEAIPPGGTFTYEFEAYPAGMQVYHCHVPPFQTHIHKGMYGNFIIDPKTPRAPAQELSMVMNGFDLDFDSDNDIYAVNSYAFAFMQEPIKVKAGKLVRIYLSSFLEFDLINSFHLHAAYFHYYATGADPEARPYYTDTVVLAQGERGLVEILFPRPGKYMFHAHVNEFTELGWVGFFEAE